MRKQRTAARDDACRRRDMSDNSPKVSVSLSAADIVDEHAGEWRADHATQAAVHALQAVVGALLAHYRDHRALEHRERGPADDADEYTHLPNKLGLN